MAPNIIRNKEAMILAPIIMKKIGKLIFASNHMDFLCLYIHIDTVNKHAFLPVFQLNPFFVFSTPSPLYKKFGFAPDYANK